MGLLTDPNSGSSQSGLGLLLVRHWCKAAWAAFVVGVAFYFVLAHPEYSHKTYFSENALLPGLVRGEFDEGKAVQSYLDSLQAEAEKYPQSVPFPWLEAMLRQIGLEVYTHNFTLRSPLSGGGGGDSSAVFTGQNVYAILRAPRSSSTESLVLSAPYRPPTSLESGTDASVAVILACAKFFRRQHYWAKDIIFLFTQHEQLGAQAWLEAYHQRSCGASGVLDHGDLEARAGSIQAAVNLEIGRTKMTHFNVKVEGLNGQLPNLDLVNLINRLCFREGVGQMFQGVEDHPRPDTWRGYKRSLSTMTRMAMKQATGVPSGNHGLFHRFGIEAVTIEAVHSKPRRGNNNNRQQQQQEEVDMYTVGRVVEGIFRSLNNLLERFHQSFFFYWLPSSNRYVSIGMYMPAFGFLGGSLVIAGLGLWVECTRDEKEKKEKKEKKKDAKNDNSSSDGSLLPVVLPSALSSILQTFLLSHVLGLAMAYLPEFASTTGRRFFKLESEDSVALALSSFAVCMILLPKFTKGVVVTEDNWKVLKCVALLELAMLAFAVSLCNFGLAYVTTALYVPVALLSSPSSWRLVGLLKMLLCLAIHPMSLVAAFSSVDSYFYAEVFSLANFANATKRALTYSITDGYIYGNINFAVATVFLVPCWYMLWCLNFAPAAPVKVVAETSSKKND